MPGPISGVCLKIVMLTNNKSLCLLELWHFPKVCFTCNSVTTCYYPWLHSAILFTSESSVPVHKVWSFKHGSLSAKVNVNANLGYSQDWG